VNKNHNKNSSGLSSSGTGFISMAKVSREIQTEIIRKLLHFLIALSPSMAALNFKFTVIFLIGGTLSYAIMETLRLAGVRVPLISSLTNMASRSRDLGRFALGPVTLGLGALAALLLYPPPAASIAIYALAFGDGIAGLAGKMLGRTRPSFLCGKSVEGSLACQVVVFLSSFLVSKSIPVALAAALTATVVEALPLDDFDNFVLPLAVGFVVQMIA
jgi:dolichol kinase